MESVIFYLGVGTLILLGVQLFDFLAESTRRSVYSLRDLMPYKQAPAGDERLPHERMAQYGRAA